MRWTHRVAARHVASGRTSDTDGEIVWSWHPVLMPNLQCDALADDGGKNAGP
jgi:hypothetical protein